MSFNQSTRDGLRWGVFGNSLLVGLLIATAPVAQAKDLVWERESSASSPTPSQSEPNNPNSPSGYTLTAQELEEVIRALDLMKRLDISSSRQRQSEQIQAQLKQLQREESSPYQLSQTQLRTLRNTFSQLNQTELTAINQLLMNRKSETPWQLTPEAVGRLRQSLRQTSVNNFSNVQQEARVTLRDSETVVFSPSSQKTQNNFKTNPPAESTADTDFAQSPSSNATREELIEQLLVPEPDLEKVTVVTERGAPAIGISVPSGFGATNGQFFAGLNFQDSTRNGNGDDDASFSFGLGLGNPEESVGLDLTYTSFSTFRSAPFDTGGFSLKVHRRLSATSSAAVGVENFIRYGEFDADVNYYGSYTNVFSLRENPTEPFSSFAVTVGLGSGRFRQNDDIQEDNETINIFGSAGLKITRQFSVVGAYTGNTLTLGASIAPFREIPLVITPAFTDLTGEFSDDPRFLFTIGYGTRLFQ